MPWRKHLFIKGLLVIYLSLKSIDETTSLILHCDPISYSFWFAPQTSVITEISHELGWLLEIWLKRLTWKMQKILIKPWVKSLHQQLEDKTQLGLLWSWLSLPVVSIYRRLLESISSAGNAKRCFSYLTAAAKGIVRQSLCTHYLRLFPWRAKFNILWLYLIMCDYMMMCYKAVQLKATFWLLLYKPAFKCITCKTTLAFWGKSVSTVTYLWSVTSRLIIPWPLASLPTWSCHCHRSRLRWMKSRMPPPLRDYSLKTQCDGKPHL